MTTINYNVIILYKEVLVKYRQKDKCTPTIYYTRLERALKSWVGRPWTDVYSDAVRMLREKSVRHHPDRLRWWLDRVVDTTGESMSGFFVHPTDGTLQYNPRPRLRMGGKIAYPVEIYSKGPVNTAAILEKYTVEAKYRLVDADSFAENVNGIWYLHTFRDSPPQSVTTNFLDGKFLPNPVTLPVTPGTPRYNFSTRQLSKKEIQRFINGETPKPKKQRGKVHQPQHCR